MHAADGAPESEPLTSASGGLSSIMEPLGLKRLNPIA